MATARYAISEGLVDMVGMMRAHMADPHIVRKLEAGQAERIRACVGASYCINRLYLGLDSLCIQNVATGREETIPQLTHAERRCRDDGSSWWAPDRPAWRPPGWRPSAGTRSCCWRPLANPAARSGWPRGRRLGERT